MKPEYVQKEVQEYTHLQQVVAELPLGTIIRPVGYPGRKGPEVVIGLELSPTPGTDVENWPICVVTYDPSRKSRQWVYPNTGGCYEVIDTEPWWWCEEWRGLEVTTKVNPEMPAGTIMGYGTNEGWVKIHWPRGADQTLSWGMPELTRVDGGVFVPKPKPPAKQLTWCDRWVGLQVYRLGYPKTIGTVKEQAAQDGFVVVGDWGNGILPGVLPIAELRLADTDEPLTEYKPWWKEEWRGVEVSPFGHPEVVGTVLGPWEHANWVQVGWVQGCEQPTNWHMCELQRKDGGVFYVL